MTGPTVLKDVPRGFSVMPFAVLGSTNDEAKRQCDTGAPAGTVIWALEQTHGRGRQRRHWQSPAGNLYFSIIERPSRPAAEATQLGFVASLAVAEAMSVQLPAQTAVSCKWPNDVLVNGRKLCGMLMESAAGANGGLDWLVIGIGVNVSWHPEDADLLYPATSLTNEGAPLLETETILTEILSHYGRWRAIWHDKGFALVRQAWLSRAYRLGQAIDVRLDRQTLSGTFRDLDPDGTLLLTNDDGIHKISAGDVFSGA